MEISTREETLYLSGGLDGRSTPEVRDALQASLAEHRVVVVDLSHVHAVDLTALRVLAFASTQAARSGQHVMLRGCSPAVRRMLHLSRLVRLVELEREPLSA